MKKSWLWILVLLIVALALRGVKGTMNKATDLVKDWAWALWDVAWWAADLVKDWAWAVGDVAWWAADLVKDWVDAVGDVAWWAVDLVKDWADAVGDVAWLAADLVKDWAEAVVDGAADVVEWAADAVKDWAEAVVDGAAGVVEWAADAVKDIEGDVDLAKSSVKRTWRAMWKNHNWIIAIKDANLDIKDGQLTWWEFTIDMNSIKATDIDSEKLDNHLKASDFFDVENHSTANLKIVSVEWNTVTADLTIKGKTAPVTFDVENKDNMMSTQFSINSQTRGIVEWVKDAIVGDDIDFDITLAY